MFLDDEYLCKNSTFQNNEENKMVIASRGDCSFLEKATNATAMNAGALIVINNSSELFQIAAGYATGSNLEDDFGVPKNLPVIMIKQHAKLALQLGAEEGLSGRMIPLRCASGESGCSPVLPEEQNIDYEVDSGILKMKNEEFEFVSGTWGGILPEGPKRIIVAEPFHACSPLTNKLEDMKDAIVLVERGKCGFGDKALNVQAGGGSVLMVADRKDTALLRMGAIQEQMNKIGIPGIIVTKESSEKIIKSHENSFVTIHPKPGFSANWLELEMAVWPEKDSAFDVMYHQLMKRNENSIERSAWLTSIRNDRYNINQPSKQDKEL
jgi:hypothetical protein